MGLPSTSGGGCSIAKCVCRIVGINVIWVFFVGTFLESSGRTIPYAWTIGRLDSHRESTICPPQVDGTKSMEEVFESIVAALDAAAAAKDPLEQYCKDAPAADECRVYE